MRATPVAGAVLLLRLTNPAQHGVRHPQAPHPPYGLKYLQALLRRGGRRAILRDGALNPAAANLRALRRLLAEEVFAAAVIDAEFGAGALAREVADVCRAGGVRHLFLGGSDAAALGIAGRDRPPFRAVVGVDLDLALAPVLCGLTPTVHDLPFPRYSSDEVRGYRHRYLVRLGRTIRYGHVLASRGCPHRCAFCSPVLRESAGTRLRVRRPGSVVAEMALRAREGANVVLFGDDDLTAAPRFIEALCERLAASRSGLPFVAHARVDELDRDRVARLARAGCELLRFGIESAAPSVLEVHRKTRSPHRWSAQARDVFSWCREEGIRTHAMFILGTPGESAADARDSLRLARRLRPDSLQIHFYTPYPGCSPPSRRSMRTPEHALAHYGAVDGERLDGRALRAWRSEFYRALYADRRWWAKQLREIGAFAVINHDIAWSLVRGVRELSESR
jgi:hypothetical protein